MNIDAFAKESNVINTQMKVAMRPFVIFKTSILLCYWWTENMETDIRRHAIASLILIHSALFGNP